MENREKGFGAIARNGDPYDFYRGKWVEVITQNETCWGKYQGIKDGYLILKPHIATESYPSDEKKEREKLFILTDEPQIITGAIVNRVSGLREESVMATISNRMVIIPKRY